MALAFSANLQFLKTTCMDIPNPLPDIFVDGVHIELSLWDTAGQEEFDRLRSLSYDDTHVIMLCFSVDSKDSLENVTSKWANEIEENCKDAKLCLVALKCDLRDPVDSQDQEEVERCQGMLDYNAGLAVANSLHAKRYLECSAMRNRGVNEAFSEASRVALEAGGLKVPRQSKASCSVM
ncbi:MAG: Rho GTPase [Vezdaea aestivalis]|nr:MAG: Rho GTPase [Vezdaea aestivalis]